MKQIIFLFTLLACITSFGASWELLDGKYETPDTDICPEKIRISYKGDVGVAQLFVYDSTRPAGENRLFSIVEGEWASGNSTYHAYEINNRQGHYFTRLHFEGPSMKLVSEIKINVVDFYNSLIQSFHLRHINYKLAEDKICTYFRRQRIAAQ